MYVAMEHYVVCDIHGEEKGLEMIRNAGFTGVDYHFVSPAGIERLADGYMDRAVVTKKILDRIGLTCVQSHAPFVYRYEHGPWENHPMWVDIHRSIEYAAYLGARQIIIHPVNVPQDMDFLDYNVSYFRSFEPAAEKFGINIAIENGGSNAQAINDLVECLDSPRFVICVDVGHANAPAKGYFVEDFMAQINLDKVEALHLNSNFGLYDHKTDLHYLPYLGNMNWEAILKALAQGNYQGDMTMEIVGHVRDLPPEVHPEALALASAIGRHLVRKFEEYKRP